MVRTVAWDWRLCVGPRPVVTCSFNGVCLSRTRAAGAGAHGLRPVAATTGRSSPMRHDGAGPGLPWRSFDKVVAHATTMRIRGARLSARYLLPKIGVDVVVKVRRFAKFAGSDTHLLPRLGCLASRTVLRLGCALICQNPRQCGQHAGTQGVPQDYCHPSPNDGVESAAPSWPRPGTVDQLRRGR